jgi:hypothetical protein
VSAGRTISLAELNNGAAICASGLFSAFDNVAKYKAVLDTLAVADLVTFGFSSADANLLKSAFTDMSNLRGVFLGTATQASPYDFRTFAKSLLGNGLY